jgi:hypothetical protein
MKGVVITEAAESALLDTLNRSVESQVLLLAVFDLEGRPLVDVCHRISDARRERASESRGADLKFVVATRIVPNRVDVIDPEFVEHLETLSLSSAVACALVVGAETMSRSYLISAYTGAFPWLKSALGNERFEVPSGVLPEDTLIKCKAAARARVATRGGGIGTGPRSPVHGHGKAYVTI